MWEDEAVPAKQQSVTRRIGGMVLIVALMIAVLVVGALPANAVMDEKITDRYTGGPIFVVELPD